MPTPSDILSALRTVRYPGYTRDIVSFGFVKDVRVEDKQIFVSLEITSLDEKIAEALKPAVREALKPFEAEATLNIEISARAPEPAVPGQNNPVGHRAIPPPPTPQNFANIRHAIAIASGKGGVGKSTVAVNLALALKQLNPAANVGLLDCDLYGPTVPLMLGLTGEVVVENGKLKPFTAHGLYVMSLGLLIDENTPVVWRGPMITKAIQQFITQVNWPALDYLIIDLPPGTGDAHLTLMQTLVLEGAIVVTTPQRTAAEVALRGAQIFEKMHVPVLGAVENMSYYPLPDGSRSTPFGTGGGQMLAEGLGVELLAQLPLDGSLRENADAGKLLDSAGPSAEIYRELAGKVGARVGKF